MHVEIIGSATGYRATFEPALQRQCDDLGVPLVLTDPPVGTLTPGAAVPDVTVAFSGSGLVWTPPGAEGDPCTFLQGVVRPVLPVVADASEAQWLPPSLSCFNAFQTGLWATAWVDGLVDEVLSLGWQRRRERRVFISYKRSDCGPIARQLYESLTTRGYVTFLDDISIPKGEEFQRELRWWLNDADAMVVLATPGFRSSRWCVEEISAAKSAGLGLIGVLWPPEVFGNPPQRHFPQPPKASPGQPAPDSIAKCIDIDQRMELNLADFTGGPNDPLWEQTLTADGLTKVVAQCVRQRARAIRLRLENLLPLAEHILQPVAGLQPAGGNGDYSFSDSAGASFFVRLLPFRPDPLALHEAFASGGTHENVGCLYSENDLQDPRATAIRWLAAGRQGSSSGSPQTTRLWACLGDREIT